MADNNRGYGSESDESFCDKKMAPGEEQQLLRKIDRPDWLELALPTEEAHAQSFERLEDAFAKSCSFCGYRNCEQSSGCTNYPDSDPRTVDFLSAFNNVVPNSVIQTVDFLSAFNSANGGQLRGDDRPLPLGLSCQRSGPNSKGLSIVNTGVSEDGQSSKHPQPPRKY